MIQINNTQYVHFLQQADVLRRSGLLCDAIISVKSQTFRAHRLVLACASRILAQQLALADIDRPVHCTLEFFSPRTFQQVLDFTYTESLEVSVDDLHLLLRAAQLLEMQPLEDQCRKQLDNLNIRAREENKRSKITRVKEEQESAEHTEQQQRRDSVQEEKLGQSASPVDKECFNISPSDSEKNGNRLPSPRKKPRLPPEPATSFNRESVITRPASSNSSFSSPWTFPPNMWSSVNTLRRIAENYSNLIATHSIQSPNQSSVAHPFSITNSQMFPLFGSQFPSSVMGYSGFQPRYTQNLYAGSSRMGSIIKQGLVKRKKHGQRACARTDQSGEPR